MSTKVVTVGKVLLVAAGMFLFVWSIVKTQTAASIGIMDRQGALAEHLTRETCSKCEPPQSKSSGWSLHVIDSENRTGYFTSIAVSTMGFPSISYYGETSGDLMFAYYDSFNWHIQTVDSQGDVGRYSSLILDGSDTPHISYFDRTNGVLKYAYWDSSTWQVQTIDNGLGTEGGYTSITMDTDGYLHISYYDSINNVLKYAYGDALGWQIQIIGSGRHSSIAVDASGNPHISYYGILNADLKYAYNDSSTWQIQTVDSQGDVGRYSSLTLDGNYNPHISYFDRTNSGLKYAYWNSSAWEVQTIDTGLGIEGGHTAIVIDSYERISISYYDAVNNDLKHAYQDPINWHIETVDFDGDVGMYSSLSLGSDLATHLSYLDYANGNLKYAYRMPEYPIFVSQDGLCGGFSPCYQSLQNAIDSAIDGSEIRVAGGVYTEVNNLGGKAQIVFLDKSLTIRGGYMNDFQFPPDPQSFPTVLDAQGTSRVIYLTGEITSTIDGLNITGGDASGLGGGILRIDGGGGIYAISATVSIMNSHIYNNVANSLGRGTGAGILLYRTDAKIISNTVEANDSGNTGIGGGILILDSIATLRNNVVSDNRAESGGGIFEDSSSTLWLENNVISQNIGIFNGGGLVLAGKATAINNRVQGNSTGMQLSGGGGGIHLANWGTITLTNNHVSENDSDIGGGILLWGCDATLENNTIVNNNSGWRGGGMYIYDSDATFINNVIADNYALTQGGAAYIEQSQPIFYHTTLASNYSGDNSGLFITGLQNQSDISMVMMTNTIIVSHVVGINATSGNTVTLESTLLNNNANDWVGAGTLLHNNDYSGSPDFVNSELGDYHILSTSLAIDNAVSSYVDYDLDGGWRSVGGAPDLGADEYCDSITEVHLIGPKSGSIGDTYIFTASVLPADPSWPLIYTWRADDQSVFVHTSNNSMDQMHYSWNDPGSYLIAIDVEHCGGILSVSDVINILQANYDNYLPIILR